MHEHIILKTIVKLLLPFVFLYALYLQAYGEYSPGGGFQAGVIFAVGCMAYSFTNGLESLQKIITRLHIHMLAILGLAIYSGVGVASMYIGGNFLNYSVLLADKISGQKLGIMVVELGVGITVFAVIMLIFYSFGGRSGNDD